MLPLTVPSGPPPLLPAAATLTASSLSAADDENEHDRWVDIMADAVYYSGCLCILHDDFCMNECTSCDPANTPQAWSSLKMSEKSNRNAAAAMFAQYNQGLAMPSNVYEEYSYNQHGKHKLDWYMFAY